MKYLLLLLTLLSSASISAQDVNDVIIFDENSKSENVPAVTQVATQQLVPANARKYGYLSYNDILKKMPEYKEAQTNIERVKAYYDKEMERAEQEFSKKFAEYVDGQKDMPQNIILKRQKELQQLMEESMKFKEEAKRLLIQSEKDIMAPLHNKLNEAIKAVGTQKNYPYVLNIDANAVPFINPRDGVDITTEVRQMLTRMQ